MNHEQDLERQSFVNLVFFFAPELGRIMNGASISEVIPQRSSRKPLYRHGVLVKGKRHRVNGIITPVISVAALEVMTSLGYVETDSLSVDMLKVIKSLGYEEEH